jgi:hypothetical protein
VAVFAGLSARRRGPLGARSQTRVSLDFGPKLHGFGYGLMAHGHAMCSGPVPIALLFATIRSGLSLLPWSWSRPRDCRKLWAVWGLSPCLMPRATRARVPRRRPILPVPNKAHRHRGTEGGNLSDAARCIGLNREEVRDCFLRTIDLGALCLNGSILPALCALRDLLQDIRGLHGSWIQRKSGALRITRPTSIDF